jgi:hypothetical protein
VDNQMIELFSGFFAAMMIGLTLLQLLMAWSSQTIADKNDLPEWAGILAWIPLANMYPVVRCGGWSFVTFLKVAAVCIALMIGLGTIAVLSGGEGGTPVIVSLGLFAVLLVVFVSFVQLMWRTAERRNLHGAVGLLLFIPLLGFLVYLYIAFYDGVRMPNKVGLLLGLVLIGGNNFVQVRAFDALSGQMQAAVTGESGEAAGPFAVFGSSMRIMEGLAEAEKLDPRDPAQLARLTELVMQIRSDIEASEAELGPEWAEQTRRSLEALEAKLPANSVAMSGAAGSGPAGMAGRLDPNRLLVPGGLPNDELGGFRIPQNPSCRPGTREQGAPPPGGLERWCANADGTRDGWYTSWFENGQIASAGEYRGGLKVGVWTRWHENGKRRVQAEFEGNMQQGVLIAWDERGRKQGEAHYSMGRPVR